MLWDNSDVALAGLIADTRGVALALTRSADLVQRLYGAMDLACVTVYC